MRKRGYGYGYTGYHGRSRSRLVLKAVIGVLAVVLALMLALFFLQEERLVFSPDGLRLDVPFLKGDGAAPPPPEATDPLVIVSAAPTPVPTPAPEPTEPLRAVMLPRSALSDGSAAARAAEAGANAVVFDMKADDGTLGYVSDLELAKRVGASASDPALNETIRTLNQQELYTVARVSCFRDNKAPYTAPALGVKTNSGYNWRDSGDLRWMSPTSEEARAYVADICTELARLGFDEILLDNSGYPTAGKLGYIKKGPAYDESQFESVISAFYRQIKAALADCPEVTLSIRTDGTVLTEGSAPLSGQSAAGMLENAGRIWADLGETPAETAVRTLTAAGAEQAEEMLVPIMASPGSDGSWAVLAQQTG